MPTIPNLKVIARNRESVLFEGEALSITSNNDRGIFDILPEHENFITLIKEKVIIRTAQKETKEIQIDNGIARVFENKVNIYVNFKI